MDTYFVAGDTRYFWIGALLILLDRLLLASVVPRRLYFWLHLPWTFLHELTHFVVALLLGGRASFSNLVPKLREDGLYALGSVEYSKVNATFGPGLVAMAPLLNWMGAAILYFFVMDSHPLGLWTGIGATLLLVGLLEAGIPSWSDIKDGQFISFCAMVGFVAGIVLVAGPKHLLQYIGLL
ncbi:TPA: hypothetical protein ACKPYM_000732 [Stenotrophomonas maltophilia]